MTASRRVGRLALLGFAVAALCLFGAMLLTAKRLNDEPGDRSVGVSVAPGVRIFEAERTGKSTTLSPGVGVAILLLGLPLVFGGAAYVAERRRGPTEA